MGEFGCVIEHSLSLQSFWQAVSDVSSVTCIVIPHIDKVNRDGSGFAIGTAVI